ncbi:MAG: GerMN domain-containing protein [Dermatophilaceae bacterium]|nr:GerMN domain-containing protein [Dermatophilaceae bacterium]
MRGVRPFWFCVVVAVASVLSACGGLPASSAVQQGSLVGEPALQPVRVQPDGPPPAGASPAQIVRGFLRTGAGTGFEDDHAIARSFFARSVKDQWRPESGVKVYADDSALKAELLTPTTVRVSAMIVAEVDSAGRYRQTPAGTLAQATFGMRKLGVGWRISAPPQGFGLWLSERDLERSYRSFIVAYVSTVARTMVVDRRWFPITPGLATTLARAQLGPVPGYLAGAARTGVPPGTRLAVDSVPVGSGRAIVDLSPSALVASPDLRRAMWAQFVTTLMQVAPVSEVSLEVKGAGLDLPDTSGRVSDLTTLGYQPRAAASIETAILRKGTHLSRVSSDSPPVQDQPLKPPNLPASAVLPEIPAGWVSLALSWNGQEIAAIGGDHKDLARWQWNRHVQLRQFGRALTRPSYDSLNGLWVAGQVGGVSRVWVIDTSVSPMEKAKPRAIQVPWLVNRFVLALKVAPDNQRAALITSDLTGRDIRVMVAGIARSAGGAPLSLAAEPLRVGWTLTSATDLAWVDDSTLAVVGRVSPKSPIGPQLVEIGGKITAMPPVAGTRLVTNTGGLRGIVVLTDRGQILARAGSGWQVLQTGTDFLIPGE